MSKTPQKAGDGEQTETALQLIKESLDEERNLVAYVFVVLGASVCRVDCNRNNLLTNKLVTTSVLLDYYKSVLVAAVAVAVAIAAAASVTF